jgi:hypothetical protein
LVLKRSLAILVLSLAGMTLGAARVHADDLTFTLNFTNGFTTCPAGGCAKVEINASGGTAVITVTSLLAGYQFDKFGFNLASSVGPVTLSSASGTVVSPGYALGGAAQVDGFGVFNYVFQTGVNGGSTGGDCKVTGGTPSAGCTFKFTLTGAGLTSASVFEILSTGGAVDGHAWFDGHVAGPSCTGYVGGGNTTGLHNGTSGCVSTPEPNTLSLLSSGLVAILLGAAFFRRRAFSAA